MNPPRAESLFPFTHTCIKQFIIFSGCNSIFSISHTEYSSCSRFHTRYSLSLSLLFPIGVQGQDSLAHDTAPSHTHTHAKSSWKHYFWIQVSSLCPSLCPPPHTHTEYFCQSAFFKGGGARRALLFIYSFFALHVTHSIHTQDITFYSMFSPIFFIE